MLHRLSCLSPFPDVAMNTAQAALALAVKIGDAKEEKAIKRSLTDLYVAKGKIDKAPNRKEALALLQDLARELEKKDGDKFKDVSKTMDNYWNALTQTDIEATLHAVISKDPTSYLAFLKVNGASLAPEESAPTFNLRTMPIQWLYYSYRLSGLGYGPRFRCVISTFKDMNYPQAMGVVELQCHDDWERELMFSASMLDDSLQVGGVQGII